MVIKILVAVFLIVAALMLLRFLSGIGERHRSRAKEMPRKGTQTGIQETRRCPTCGTYVPAHHPRSCGRPSCPY